MSENSSKSPQNPPALAVGRFSTETKPETRWRAVAWYRTDAGLIDIEHQIDELEELAEIVEQGPSFGALEKVEIFYNWGCGKTIEQCTKEASRRPFEGSYCEDKKRPGDCCATCSLFDLPPHDLRGLHGGEDHPRCWYGVPATAEHWCLEHKPKQ